MPAAGHRATSNSCVALGAVPRDAADPRPGRARARLQEPGRRDPPPQPRPPPARAGRRRRRPRRRRDATSRSSSSAPATRASRPWRSSRTSCATPFATTPACAEHRRRWVLVDAAPKILAEIPSRLGEYADKHLRGRVSRSACRPGSSRSRRIPSPSPTAPGSRPKPWSGRRASRRTRCWPSSACRLTNAGGCASTPLLRVEGRERLWSLGDNARVPNQATPDRPDPPTCQHALASAPAGQEPHGHAQAVPIRDARPGGHTRPLQGHRRRARRALERLPRLVHYPYVPPLSASPALPADARVWPTGRPRSSSAATSPS